MLDQVGHALTSADRIRVRRWIIKAKLAWWDKQAAAETKLTRILRTIARAAPEEINQSFSFPYEALCEEGLVDGGPNLWVQKHDAEANGEGLCISKLLATPKGHQTTRFLLGLVQTNVHDDEVYEVDHCFPYRECRDSEDEDWQRCADSLPNLQLLESRLNSSKSDRPFWDWYATLPELLTRNSMPERLQAANREELSLAHAWPAYLFKETYEQQVLSPREALFHFHAKRKNLLAQRLNVVLLGD